MNPDLPLVRARVQLIKAGCCSVSKNQYSTSTVPETREGLRSSWKGQDFSTLDQPSSTWHQCLGFPVTQP